MYGQMCDIFYYNSADDCFVYYNNMTVFSFISNRFPKGNIYFILKFEYGRPVTNIREIGEAQLFTLDKGKEIFSILLHPVIQVFNTNKELIDEIHFEEDLLTNFVNPLKYHDKFLRTIKMFI
jgi:hypothetical protein